MKLKSEHSAYSATIAPAMVPDPRRRAPGPKHQHPLDRDAHQRALDLGLAATALVGQAELRLLQEQVDEDDEDGHCRP